MRTSTSVLLSRLGALLALASAAAAQSGDAARAQAAQPDAAERAALVGHAGIPAGRAVVLHAARVELPLTRTTVLSAKLLDTATGEVRVVSLDGLGQPVERGALEAAELALSVSRNGLLDVPLAERLGAVTDPAQLIPVAIWLTGPDTSVAVERVRAQGHVLVGGRPAGGDDDDATRAALLAEKAQLYAASHAAFLDAVRTLGGRVDYASTLAPLVMARLTVAQIEVVAALPGVQRLHDSPALVGKLLLGPALLMDTANPAVQNAAMVAAGFTGKPDIKVGVVESGLVKFTNPFLGHLNGQTFDAAASIDDHATWVAGVIGLKGNPTYKGIAPDVSMLSANYTFGVANGIYEPAGGAPPLTCETTAAGDDVQLVPVGNVVVEGQLLVTPGANKLIDSVPGGNDSKSWFFESNMANFTAAADWAVTQGARILNFSIGEVVSDLTFDVSDKYLDHLVFEHFVACCVAAGNEAVPDAVIEPASGGNGKADTAKLAGSDDVQEIGVGAAAAPGATIVSKGPDGVLDTFVLGPGDHFAPVAGSGRVTSPGLAYNVITVGAMDDKDTPLLLDDTIAAFSNWDQAGLAGIAGLHGDFQKPELSAPGRRIISASAVTNDPDGNGIINSGVGGTSFSTPMVCGYIANMIHMDGTLANWPEATKAIALATATRSVSVPALESPGVGWDDVEGAGTIVIDDGYDLIRTGRYDKGTATAADFPLERLVFLQQDEVFRYAIAWSSHTSVGTPASITDDLLQADLDLHLYKPGETMPFKSGATFDNAYEVVAFRAPVTGVYRAEIRAQSFTAASEYLGEAWTVRASWFDLLSPLAGAYGFPVFTGAGLLLAGHPVSVTLSNAKENALAYMFIGLTAANLAFKGGVMVPTPTSFVPLSTNGSGTATLGLVWPAGLPPDLSFVLQMWIKDPAGPAGFSASNAIKGVTL